MAPTDFSTTGDIARRLLHVDQSVSTKPTRTLPDLISRVITARQDTTVTTTSTVVPASTSHGITLSGGAIAGIVIGSIVGFLLILWLIRSCTNLGNPGLWGSTFEPGNEKPPSNYPSAPRHHHSSSARRSRSRHSHQSRSPRRVSVVTAQQPVVYKTRSRSPQPPPAAYYGRRSTDGRDVRRSSDARRYRRY
ncbi:hypothetical protein F5Y18DRAFT_71048 [Xylariaceae sp. FL1019]|nr:hypothetical protein F5Y18DRAFT_71048 [Xylariaceae sp. FL1019]